MKPENGYRENESSHKAEAVISSGVNGDFVSIAFKASMTGIMFTSMGTAPN